MRPEEEKKMDIINVNKKSKNSMYTLSVPLLFIFQKKKKNKKKHALYTLLRICRPTYILSLKV